MRHQLPALLVFLSFIIYSSSQGATLPAGFTERVVASGLLSPTATEFAPDGRLFVCQQSGDLRVIKNDSLLTAPFISLAVDNSGERGLLGVTFDPNFSVNHYIYVYYTATSPTTHNRVSRFTANGDVAVAGSELILLDLPTLGATNHNGGAMHFGSDGKIYIAVGENAVPSNSQSLSTPLGKILRMNTDGTAPSDNPFYSTSTGLNRLIWAYGVRNPFTFSFQSGTGKLYINDVGQSTWEEIDYGIAGANYGWPTAEGMSANPSFVNPMFVYGHTGAADLSGCAITGGAFYNPSTTQFPAVYVGQYFFADYCNGWIREFHPADSTATGFASGISAPVDLKVSTDGALYYLARGFGSNTGLVAKIIYTSGSGPSITLQPADQTVTVGSPATFTTNASGASPLSYQWQKNGVNIAGATTQSYTLSSAQSTDNGALIRCVVTNAFGTATSNAAILTVTSNRPPTATITAPLKGSFYTAGDTISFTGTGTDPEQGSLSGSSFTWQVDFQHNIHHHPFYPPTSGITSGSFVIPTTGETSDTVWYRMYLTVTDTGRLSSIDTAEIFPKKSNVTITTNPTGLQILLDGIPQTSPYNFTGVVGSLRDISAVTPQLKNGQTFIFSTWSDGGAADHVISTPATNLTYAATYLFSPPAPALLLPANGASGQPGTLTFRWNNSIGASTYRYQLATDSLFVSNSVDDSALTDTMRIVSGLGSNTTYYWRVNAKNTNGVSAWSLMRRFSTLDNIAPTVSITSPAPSSTVSNSITVSATASDNIAVAGVQFRLDGSILASEDTTAPFSVVWNTLGAANGTHFLTAAARDAAGNATTSASVSVTVSNSSGTSDLVMYQNTALNVPWTDKSTGGTVNVLNSTDQIYEGTTSIKVTQGHWGAASFMNGEWGTVKTIDGSTYSSIDFAIYAPNPLANLAVGLGSVGTVFRAGPQPANRWINVSIPLSAMYTTTTLFSQFYINDVNDNATTVFYLDNIRFVGKAPQAPPPSPVLLAPADGSTNQPATLNLSWNASLGAVTYRVQLSDATTFSSLLLDDSAVTTTSRQLSALVAGRTYYWRVNAKNAVGTSPYSVANNYTTAPPAPMSPVLLTPADGSTNQPVTLSLTWNASSGAATYRVELSDAATFSSILVDDSTVTTTSRQASGLVAGKTYYWRVDAKNASGTSSWSAVNSFTTAPPAPSAPVLLTPPNGSTNQLLTLSLTWNASSGAVTYRVQLSDAATFGSLVLDDSTVTTTSRQVNGLVAGKSYYWRVNAKNAVGTSPYSAVNSFTTTSPAPPAPVLMTPMNGSTNQSVPVSLTWNASSGAATYRVQLSDSATFGSLVLDDSTVTTTSRQVSGLLAGKTYCCRVNAKNVSGTSSYSTVNAFTTTPPDTSSPVVTMTSPASGSILSGTVTVSANAADNIGLTRVEFYLGTTLLASDTSAPYSISWNSSGVPNGAYSFSARGYDAAGNLGISAGVPVTVSNSLVDLNIYQDGALAAPWTNKSTGGTVNVFNSTEQVYQGASSIKVTQGHWGSASFMNGDWGTAKTIDGSKYSSIDFAIYAPNPLVNLSVGLSGIGTPYRVGPQPANKWIIVSVPMSAMVTTTPFFTQFYIHDLNDNSTTVFYLDNIRFVKSGSAATAGIVSDRSGADSKDNSPVPDHFDLSQNFPNPFNPTATISYSLPMDVRVSLKIFNLLGQEVLTLVDGFQTAGYKQVTIDKNNMPSGVYFYRLQAGDFVEVKKMILAR